MPTTASRGAGAPSALAQAAAVTHPYCTHQCPLRRRTAQLCMYVLSVVNTWSKIAYVRRLPDTRYLVQVSYTSTV